MEYARGPSSNSYRTTRFQYPLVLHTLMPRLLIPTTGWIPLMLPFGFADFITSTLDWPSLYDTVYITGRETIRNLKVGKI